MTSFPGVVPYGIRNTLRFSVGYVAALYAKRSLIRKHLPTFQGLFVPGNSPLLVRTDNFFAYARPRTSDLAALMGRHEQAITWFHPKSDDTCIDVGAHIGAYTLRAALVGARCFALEPEESNFAILRKNLLLNGLKNVMAMKVAASDADGKGTLYVNSCFNTGMHSLEEGHRAPSNKSTTIELRRLDTLFRELDRVDWLKIDVEGHEDAVLRGGIDTLRKSHNVIIEVSGENGSFCHRLFEKERFRTVKSEPYFGAVNLLLSKPLE